jgi:hypothetical protein
MLKKKAGAVERVFTSDIVLDILHALVPYRKSRKTKSKHEETQERRT